MKSSLPPFSCTHTQDLPELLGELNCSLLLSTYQADKLIVVSSNGEKLTQLPRTFDTPMGVAIEGDHMSVATQNEVINLINDPRLAINYPNKPNHYDALYTPRSAHFCGQLQIHDLVHGSSGLIGVSTLFSCLFELDDTHSFKSIWQPDFITELAPEDRCHLNGLCLENGRPKYVTAFASSNTPQGWRKTDLESGLLIDTTSNEIILDNLSMPHSPRIFDGELYLLLSGKGQVVRVSPAARHYEVICEIPAFLRGLAKRGDYLFVGASKLRKNHLFGDTHLAREGKTFCGVMVIHLPTGAIVSQMNYVNSCEEIYDVQILPDRIRPGLLGTQNDLYQQALSLESGAYWAARES